MDEEEEEIERNINNITCDTVTKNVQNKDENLSLERRLAAGVLVEMVKEFNECTIQSDKQADTIIYYEEHFDARNWLRSDSTEQVDVIYVSKKSVVDGKNPKSYSSVATDTTNGNSATDTTNGISTQNYSSTQPSKLLSNPLPRSSPSK